MLSVNAVDSCPLYADFGVKLLNDLSQNATTASMQDFTFAKTRKICFAFKTKFVFSTMKRNKKFTWPRQLYRFIGSRIFYVFAKIYAICV